jgi:hypothetical protein
MHEHVVESGVDEALEVLDVQGRIGAARNVLGHVFLADGLRSLLEVARLSLAAGLAERSHDLPSARR